MSELRHDPIQRRWVIIATDRKLRPEGFVVEPDRTKPGASCPFCPGQEEQTPPEIVAVRAEGTKANSPGWEIRVVPNKYPALTVDGELVRKGVGIYDQAAGVGAHEVVIEGPEHERSMADFPIKHSTAVYRILQERLIDLMRDTRLKYVLLFKNHGASAGASLPHPHHQVIATPVTPKTVAMELDAARQHYTHRERCIFCDMIQYEIDSGERIITLTDRFVAFAPYASRFPFEVFVAPRYHQHSFAETADEDLEGLARIMRDVLLRLRTSLGNPPFNYVFHTAPNAGMLPRRPNYWATLQHDFHWHIEILPRLVRFAGFEWGSGFHINPTPPEEAADYLRGTEIDRPGP